MDHAKHIIRAVLLLVLLAVAFVFVRHFAIPETFGMHGHYRFSNVAEHAAKSIVHGAPGACAECHSEQAKAVSEGKHSSVSCEVCHAPLAVHVQDSQRVAQMPVQRSYLLCARCHQRVVGRPKEFPQVVLKDHVTEKGGEMVEGVCQECHNVHNPSK
jgi:hypothetical protein